MGVVVEPPTTSSARTSTIRGHSLVRYDNVWVPASAMLGEGAAASESRSPGWRLAACTTRCAPSVWPSARST